MEFPEDCLTNAYVLKGFEEIAYIVCTVARIPQNVINQQKIPEQSDSDRLKKTERELRAASLLVSLDVDKLELFTFYRKADLMKDQKLLTSKFGPVLRSNYCIISYKTYGAAVQLLKPEQSRIYGLFVRAVLSSISPLLFGDEDILPLGPRSFAKRITDGGGRETDGRQFGDVLKYELFNIFVQIIPSGKVVVSYSRSNNNLNPLVPNPKVSESQQSIARGFGSVLVLAPCGQVGRYQWTDCNMSSTPSNAQVQETNNRSLTKLIEGSPDLLRKCCIKQIGTWLNQYFPRFDWTRDEEPWVEVEIPIIWQPSVDHDSTDGRMAWMPILWPVRLCLCVPSSDISMTDPRSPQNGVDEDLCEFFQSWAMKSDQAIQDLLKQDTAVPNGQNYETTSDISFDEMPTDPPFPLQSAALVDFAPSQMIYPTPPDGPMTQPTPGVLSFDGVDVSTPQLTRHGPDSRQENADGNAMELDEMQHSGVGTGFYDEDLFDEIPNNKYAPPGVTEEPNWDFFDQPNMESPDANATPGPQRDLTRGNDITSHRNVVMDSSEGGVGLSKDVESSMKVQNKEERQNGPSIEQVAGNEHEDEMVLEQSLPTGSKVGSKENEESKFSSNVHQAASPNSSRHLPKIADEKYHPSGRFWFSSMETNAADQSLYGMKSSRKRAASSSHRPQTPSPSTSVSTSEDSDFETPGDDENLDVPVFHKWTEYERPTGETADSNDSNSDYQKIQANVDAILTMLRESNYDIPLSDSVQAMLENSGSGHLYEVKEISSVAQILVDQVSQTVFQAGLGDLVPATLTMLSNSWLPALREIDHAWERSDVAFFTRLGMRDPTEDESRVTLLDRDQVSLQRLDKPITALPSIISLWDSLDLQPNASEKPIVTYCIHPRGTTVQDGCRILCDRLQETYQGCNLGTFTFGKAQQSSPTGFFEWSQTDQTGSTLEKACEILGAELSQVADGVPATMVVIMINPWTHLESYVRLCDAFYQLFTTYRKGAKPRHRIRDIALQVVPISFVASFESLTVPTRREYVDLAIEIYNRCPPANAEDKLWYCGSAAVLADPPHRTAEFELTSELISPLSRGGDCLHLCYSYSTDKRWVTAAWTDERGFVALTMSYCMRLRGSITSRPVNEVIQEMWEISLDLMAKHRSKWRLVVAKDGYYEATELNCWFRHCNNIGGDSRPRCTLVLISVDVQPSLQLQLPPHPLKQAQQSQSGPSPYPPTRDAGTPTSTPQAMTTSPTEQVAIPSTPMTAATPGATNAHHSQPSASQPADSTPPGPPPPSSSDPSNLHLPGATSEPSILLQNPQDTHWSVLLSHGLSQSCNPLDARPALASGYLFQRQGLRDEDGVSALGVSLVYVSPGPAGPSSSSSSSSSSTAAGAGAGGGTGGTGVASTVAATVAGREELLSEVLRQFGALVVLGHTRWGNGGGETGTGDAAGGGRGRDALPWHVATAVIGARVCGRCF